LRESGLTWLKWRDGVSVIGSFLELNWAEIIKCCASPANGEASLANTMPLEEKRWIKPENDLFCAWGQGKALADSGG
jgi:hypothetical protein